MVENFIKILANGLRYYNVSFKDVLLDITPEEQNGISDSLSYSAEKKPLNSAEQNNLELREKYKIKSYDVSDLIKTYKTKAFLLSYTKEIIEISDYLTKVIHLALAINDKLIEICKETRKIKRNKNLTKDDSVYQATKYAVSSYIDILRKINISIDDLRLNQNSHQIEKNYAFVESIARLAIEQSQIPDEMASEFNALYQGINLKKFSDLKKQKNSKNENMASFTALSDKLYASVIKIFLSYLMEEFYYYVTSDIFLNNPDGKAVFVVPLSKYKLFNFQKSGLLRQELPSVSSQKDKFAEENKEFFNEVYSSLNSVSEQAKTLLNTIESKDDYSDVDWLANKFEELNSDKKGGKLTSIKKMIKDSPAFREYMTSLFYELKYELVEIATCSQNAWEPKLEGTKDDKEMDKDCAYFLCYVFQRLFSQAKYPNMQIQTIRFVHMFSYNDRPEKSFRVYLKKFNSGTLIWPDTDLGRKFKDILDR